MLHEIKKSERLWGSYQHLSVTHDKDRQTAWGYMNPEPLPCFTPTLASESLAFCDAIAADPNIHYLVAASAHEKVYNLGGDLDTFIQLIEKQDRATLTEYVYNTVKLGHACVHQLYNDVTTIALIQGVTIGGGFEGALSCNTLIAEEKATFIFPELLFNMFPGMGAYTYLAMRVSPAEAHNIIASGKQYSAREMFDMGVIDVLVKDGEGVDAVNDYIDGHATQRRGHLARHKARLRHQPIHLDELTDIVDIWLDNALSTTPADMNTMTRLLKAQRRVYKVKN